MHKGYGIGLIAVLPLITSFTSSGCAVGCTTIGCDGGLIVRFVGNLPISATAVSLDPDQKPLSPRSPPGSVECHNGQPCAALFFPEFKASTVVVTAQSQGGSTSQTFTPTYRRFQPNGEDCEPICRIAEIEMTL